MSSALDTLTGKSARKANEATEKATQQFKNIDVPEIKQMELDLERLVQQGELSPEQAQAILLERSAMEDISADSRFKDAQISALDSIRDIAESGGLNAQAKARLSQIQSEEANQERGAREAILQNMAQRGMAGGGQELAAQLANQQGSAQRTSQRNMDVAAMAEAQALQAIMNQGQMSGSMRGQDFAEQSQVAQAKDAIQAFNAQNRQQVNFTNVAANNNAQAQNLAERQRVADQNVNLVNQQQAHNKALHQQNFQNEMQRAGGIASGYTNQAQQYQATADRNAGFTGGIIETGGRLAAAGATGGASEVALAAKKASDLEPSDREVKENIEEVDPAKLLDEITCYKYKYKRPEDHGDGEQIGIMAQDLEKFAPQAVEEDEEGVKRIDYSKLGGPILAALASMNERIKKVEDK